jgi:predicted enzyme related to lactoylglutathione lyase
MFGRFLEVSLATHDIAASVLFYEQLGFQQLPCTDAWKYPYCAMSDGRLCLGLHQRPESAIEPAMVLSFVRPGIVEAAGELQRYGVEIVSRRLGFEDFHELLLRDPTGQHIKLIEARTCSPDAEGNRESDCGYFTACSLPCADVLNTTLYWSAAGFIAYETEALPYEHQLLGSDRLNLWLHDPTALRQFALVFTAEDMPNRLEALRTRGHATGSRVPFQLARDGNATLLTPDGTQLLLLETEP